MFLNSVCSCGGGICVGWNVFVGNGSVFFGGNGGVFVYDNVFINKSLNFGHAECM